MIAAELDLNPDHAPPTRVTYRERLYWLEYVEAVLPINEHIEDGLVPASGASTTPTSTAGHARRTASSTPAASPSAPSGSA